MKPLAEYRNHFPILAHTTYLNSNSMGAMPKGAAGALAAYAREWETEGVEAWNRWLPMVQEVADMAGRFFGAGPGETILNQNVSTFMASIATSLDLSGARNKVVLSSLDFPSVLYVWERFAKYGAKIEIVPSDDGIDIPTQRILDAIDERTAIVPISHSYYVSSALADIPAIVQKAHRVGALVAVDVYQTAGVLPIDVKKWNADFVVGGSHKWLCGGPGTCFMYVRPELRGRLEPRTTGWFAHAEPFSFEPPPIRYADNAWRYMGGTPSMPAYFVAREAYRIMLEVGIERISEQNRLLTKRAIEKAQAAGLDIHTPLDMNRRAGFVAIDFPGADKAVNTLIAEGYKLDYRPNCGLRMGPHFYNSPEEIDRFIDRAAALARR